MQIEQFDTSRHLGQVLDLFKTSLSNTGDEKWFLWKHLNGPWGPSLGLVAIASHRVIGARFFMKWHFMRNGHRQKALRPVDTVTHPEARGKGVFKKLTLHGLDAFEGLHDNIIFNTPNEYSLPGYLKMGWKLYPWCFRHYFFLELPVGKQPPIFHPRVSELTIPTHHYHENASETEKSPAFIAWRYGHDDYRFSMFSQKQDALLVYKILKRKGFTVLSVKDFVGSSVLREPLIRATARSLNVVVGHDVESPARAGHSGFARVFRGQSKVAMRTTDENLTSSFVFSPGDLEGIM